MTVAVPKQYMTREEYRRWYETQPGRFERVDGRVYAMSPERIAHVRVKTEVLFALRRAIAVAGVRCEAFGDGVTVETESGDYEPDASVNCGRPIDANLIALPNPIIVVEVLSPRTASIDSSLKLTGYFSVPSIQHYLIVHPDRHSVIHHRRADERIDTSIVAAGPIVLDPPGLLINVEELYPAA